MIRLVLLSIAITAGCATPSYVTKHDIKVFNKSQEKHVTQANIEIAVDLLLEALNKSADDIGNTSVMVVDVAICQPITLPDGSDGVVIIDGYTQAEPVLPILPNEILVSTIRGCFDSVVHEVAHLLHPTYDEDHEDTAFWNVVGTVEEKVRGDICGVERKACKFPVDPKVCE